MSKEVFLKALEYNPEAISIGGGEPTLHPQFKEFLIEAIGSCDYVWLATNGSQTDIMELLYKLAIRKVISVALSIDKFHNPIDWEIEDKFQRAAQENTSYKHVNNIEIRCTEDNISKQGRAKINELYTDDCCPCSTIIIKPNGDIYQCGCDDAPKIGDVFNGFKGIHNCWDCHKKIMNEYA